MRVIPIVDVPAAFAAESMRRMAPEARALVAKATRYVPKPIIKALDRVSRSYLARSDQPHLEEIDEVSRRLGLPGAYFLNVNFEWGCTVKAYQSPRGPEMVRVLDWSTPGLGNGVVMLKVESGFGPWFTPSWAGFAGIVHGFAPGRFAVAMNQAPLAKYTRIFPIDWAIERKQVWSSMGMLPSHLLRAVMERASGYDEACDMMMSTPLCIPAIFSIVGVREGEHAIVERVRDKALLHAGTCTANHFDMQPDGYHRGQHSWGRAAMLRALECDPEDRDFSWLLPPVLNKRTVVAFVANPSRGSMIVCGIDGGKRVTETLSLT